MKLKNRNGITIIALLITVIIMLILAGVGLYFGTDAIRRARLEDIRTNMLSIKTKAKIIVEQYNFKDIDALVGSEIGTEEANKLDITDTANARKLSSSDLESLGLPNSIEENMYIVLYNLEDPNDCEVYYLEGYELEGYGTMYSLTDLQDI